MTPNHFESYRNSNSVGIGNQLEFDRVLIPDSLESSYLSTLFPALNYCRSGSFEYIDVSTGTLLVIRLVDSPYLNLVGVIVFTM